MPRVRARPLAAGAMILPMAVATACSAHTSFAQLAFDAHHVPVPAAVTLAKEQRSVEDGPGFTSATSREVTLTFVNDLACPVLEARWETELHRAGRQFHVDAEPRLFGASGLTRIVLDDRSENLGITIGSITGQGTWIGCASPFVWSFENPT